jgi:manganese efflux pump family protein
MNFFEVLLIAFSMAMDAFAVCLGAGTQQQTSGPRPTFRLAFHFGLFQCIMPILGWFAGTTIEQYIANFDHWVAFGLLAFVGLRMVRAGFSPDEQAVQNDPSRGWTLVLLAFATSIDALAIGFSLAIVGIVIWYPAVVIGVVTGLVSWLGIFLGNRLGARFGKRMGIAGGTILVLIGLRILVSHLFGI